MRIRLTVHRVLPSRDGRYTYQNPGDVITVDPIEGRAMIKAGQAEPLVDTPVETGMQNTNTRTTRAVERRK